MPPRRAKKNANKPKSADLASAVRAQVLQNTGGSAATSSSSSATGPSDAERRYPKLTDEQVAQFLADDSAFEASLAAAGNENGDDGGDGDDECKSGGNAHDDGNENDQMPEPRPLDDVFGGGGGGAAQSNGNAGGSGLLSKLLDPDAGGVGNNRDGVSGLVAPPKASGDARQRLRQKIRAMRQQRAPIGEQDVVRDKRGRKVPGQRILTQEAMQAGIRQPRNTQVDATLTAQKRKELFEKMKADMAAKRQQQQPQMPSIVPAKPLPVTDDDDIGR